ncbi:MAG TPA: hypothetical protein VEX18_18395, partial [Polyangiaceae bacterium]|nr:hypothetical protein [Polyangiaceae bacterium]
VERQKQAIKQALEAADRREMSKSAPNLHMSTEAPDEPATVLEGIGREMTPSADGRSLPGASSTEPPPSFARAERSRRRNLVLVASSVLVLGLGLGFAFGRDEGQQNVTAASPVPPSLEPLPAPKAAQSTEPSVIPSAPSPPPLEQEGPATGAPSAKPAGTPSAKAAVTPSAKAAITPRPGGGKRSGVAKPVPSASASGNQLFLSPIRTPGF